MYKWGDQEEAKSERKNAVKQTLLPFWKVLLIVFLFGLSIMKLWGKVDSLV